MKRNSEIDILIADYYEAVLTGNTERAKRLVAEIAAMEGQWA